MAEKILPASNVFTDSYTTYDNVSKMEQGYIHHHINHSEKLYVMGDVHTQTIEGFWSLLKRALGGTYVSVEPFRLFRYLDEQSFRFNNRATKDNPLNDADRFSVVLSQVSGKRLTYKEVTGKVGETATF